MQRNHTVLEPVYEFDYQCYVKNISHHVSNMRNVTFVNAGNVDVMVNRRVIVPGGQIIIDTDGIIEQRFEIVFLSTNNNTTFDNTLTVTEPRLEVFTTYKAGYREYNYNIING